MNYVCPNYVLIECVIAPSTGYTGAKNPFSTQKELQNRKVVGVETFSAQDVTNSPISVSNAVINQAIFMSTFLTLYRASTPAQGNYPAQTEGLYYDQLPLANIRRCNNYNTYTSGQSGPQTSSINDLFRMKPAEMTWTKSYCTCAPSIAISATYSALFGIHYLNENEDWKPYM